MRKTLTIAAALLSLPLSLSAAPKAPSAKCERVTVGDSQVWAKRTKAGNYSTTECEVEISIRYTKRTARYEIRPTKNPWHCTAWVNPASKPVVDLNKVAGDCMEALEAIDK